VIKTSKYENIHPQQKWDTVNISNLENYDIIKYLDSIPVKPAINIPD